MTNVTAAPVPQNGQYFQKANSRKHPREESPKVLHELWMTFSFAVIFYEGFDVSTRSNFENVRIVSILKKKIYRLPRIIKRDTHISLSHSYKSEATVVSRVALGSQENDKTENSGFPIALIRSYTLSKKALKWAPPLGLTQCFSFGP